MVFESIVAPMDILKFRLLFKNKINNVERSTVLLKHKTTNIDLKIKKQDN